MISDPKIPEFWEWFARVAPDLEADPTRDELIAKMDAHVRNLGPFAWEIGPGTKEQWQLVISPGGNSDLMQASKAVVVAAPAIRGWEFHAAKQPRDWDLRFSMLDHESVKRDIDARGWRYLLLQHEDGSLDLVIRAPELMNLPPNDRHMAIEICLDGLIGEVRRLELFRDIDVCSEFDEPSRGGGIALPDMPAHLGSMGLV